MIILLWVTFLTLLNIVYLVKYKEFKKCVKFLKASKKYKNKGVALSIEQSHVKPLHKIYHFEVPVTIGLFRRPAHERETWQTLALDFLTGIQKHLESKECCDVSGDITSLNMIDDTSELGQLLMMAIARLTCTVDTSMSPDDVINSLQRTRGEVYGQPTECDEGVVNE